MGWLLPLAAITVFLQIWTGGFCQKTIPCQPGFSSDNFVFTVHRNRLHRGKILGRVGFDICTDQKRFPFISDDNRFKVETDGTVKVKRDVKLHHGHISFFIHGWDSLNKKITSRITVEYQRPHHTGHEQNDQSESQNIVMFPHSSGLKRHKREWVIPPINIPENQRGTFPKQVVQIKSSKSKESIIHYSITGPGADLPPTGLFKMDRDSGWLLVTEPLDREKQSEYLLTVHAVSISGNIAEDPMEITVIVLDQNDNKPAFISNTFVGNVSEGSQPGTSVMTVTAIDKDDPTTDNGMFKFSILSQTPLVPYPQMFTINQDTGTISVIAAGLDREKESEYTLILQVADMNGEGLSNTATASITVLDQNDNAPQFNPTNYNRSVPENAVDFEVVRLMVTDNDEPHTPAWNAKYRIVKGNDGGNFGITTDPDSNDGIVKTIKGLDFEAKRQYILLITVENEVPFSTPSPTSTATLTVTVEDVNEAPIFSPPTLSVPVKEDVPLNTFITTYQAKDPDIEMKQTVSYRIGNDPAGWLNVDKDSGMITVKQEMDRESSFVKNDKYTALIYAYDNANPPATGTGTLVLVLEDVNDNGPVVDVVGDVRFCNQKPPPQEFSVVDPDSVGNAGPFRAELLREARRNWTVSMNDAENKIILSMTTQLPPGEYDVVIRAYDNGNKNQDTTLKVTVCDCTGAEFHCPRPDEAGIGLPAVLAILGAILALLILLLLLLMLLRRKRKVKKDPLLPEDDIRDNVFYYDEEGGGEEDQEYDLSQLHRGLDARPGVYRDDVEPSMMPAPKYRPRPANPEDIGNFIEDNLKTADNDPTAPPYDSLLVFDYEGAGSEAGSLSSLHSDSSGGDQDYDCLNQWGPRFKKLADMYGGEDD
uniref:Cadherin-1 n=1 Tax=Erpetoichthys calabaricus TaxID=27687 RepID=A0A8C4XAP8_ERPCA